MNPQLEALFDEPEKRYLQPEELNALSQYVSSLPERINLYRRLRSEEITLMQQVADTLQQQMAGEPEDLLKRSLKNGLLALRYAAMAMLTDDVDFVKKRMESWLPGMVEAYGTRAIDERLHQLIYEQLSGRFTPQQMALLSPGLVTARSLLAPQEIGTEADLTSETLVGLF